MGGSFLYNERLVHWLSGLGKRHASQVASVTYAMHETKSHEKNNHVASHSFIIPKHIGPLVRRSPHRYKFRRGS